MEAGAHAVLLTMADISLEGDGEGKYANIDSKNQNNNTNGDER